MLILFRINCVLASVVIGGILWLFAGIAYYSNDHLSSGFQTLNYIFSFVVVGGNAVLFILSLDRSYFAAKKLFKFCVAYACLVIAYFLFLTFYENDHLDFQILSAVFCLLAFKVALSFGVLCDALPAD
jgi:hypothetical protein